MVLNVTNQGLVAKSTTVRVWELITVSTVLYVEWGRLGEIGDLYVLLEHRRCGLILEHRRCA